MEAIDVLGRDQESIEPFLLFPFRKNSMCLIGFRCCGLGSHFVDPHPDGIRIIGKPVRAHRDGDTVKGMLVVLDLSMA